MASGDAIESGSSEAYSSSSQSWAISLQSSSLVTLGMSFERYYAFVFFFCVGCSRFRDVVVSLAPCIWTLHYSVPMLSTSLLCLTSSTLTLMEHIVIHSTRPKSLILIGYATGVTWQTRTE